MVGDSAFHFTVDDDSIEVHDGRTDDPDLVLTTDEETWTDIAAGKITASEAASSGALAIAGDRQASKRLGKIFSRDKLLASR